MACTKQTARRCTGEPAPRQMIASLGSLDDDKSESHISEPNAKKQRLSNIKSLRPESDIQVVGHGVHQQEDGVDLRVNVAMAVAASHNRSANVGMLY
jgi:hypothetical protein